MVHQVRRHHVLQRGKHVLNAAWVLLLPLAQHLAHHLALQTVLAAAQGARDDGELTQLGPTLQVLLGHVGEGANHHVVAAVTHQLGRHALELAAEEHVQEEGLQDVVAVVAERDFVAT